MVGARTDRVGAFLLPREAFSVRDFIMMQEIEQALRIIVGSEKGEVRDALAVLDKIVVESTGVLSPRLTHFLERRSYLKALDYIENGESSA